MAMPRPNLLIVMSDEHAPQFSGAYGHSQVRTPHIDQLAREGVLFESAYCNSPVCVPSRMSFMTGRYVHQTVTSDLPDRDATTNSIFLGLKLQR